MGEAWSAIRAFPGELLAAFAALKLVTGVAVAVGITWLVWLVQPFFVAGAFVVAYRALNNEATSQDQYINACKERYIPTLFVTIAVNIIVGGFLTFGGSVLAAIALILVFPVTPGGDGKELSTVVLDIVSNPVFIVVAVVVLLLTVVLMAILQFATVAAVVDKRETADALKKSYSLFSEHTSSVISYTVFKEGLVVLLVTIPLFAVPILLSANVVGLAALLEIPPRVLPILGSLVAIPAAMSINTFHVAYYERLKNR